MRLQHIVPSLEERHGGPSRSVAALANALARQNHHVELLATADPESTAPNATGTGAQVRRFERKTPRFLTRAPALRAHLLAHPADCIHNHALWLLPLRYAHEAARKHGAPLVISPRGMMSTWAYHHHRWRKQLSRAFVHPGALEAASGWHATSQQEADDIRALGFTQPICVSPNGVPLPSSAEIARARAEWLTLCPAAGHRPVALFYSRFHRKKRVRELIELWQTEPRGDWLLLIVGVEEEYDAAELNAAIETAGAGEHIKVFNGRELPPPYAIASLFLLPSHSENFGLVIAEALAASVPVLVTDTTPWHGTAAHECGWCVAWEQFPDTLRHALSHHPEKLTLMGQRGRTWMESEFSWDRAAQILSEFYGQLKR